MRPFMHSARGCRTGKKMANEAEGASRGKIAWTSAEGSASA